MKYVTLCLAKDHLKVDHDEDDFEIERKIEAASSMVKSYIKTTSPYEPARDANDDPVLDSAGYSEDAYTEDGELAVRYEVQAATLLLVQLMYDQTLHERYAHGHGGFLPPEVSAILYPLRDPTFA